MSMQGMFTAKIATRLMLPAHLPVSRQVGLVDMLQLVLPGKVLLLLLHSQLAVSRFWRHKQRLLETQAFGSQCAHEGLK